MQQTKFRGSLSPRVERPAHQPVEDAVIATGTRVQREGMANWMAMLLGMALPVVLWAALWGLSKIGDSTRVSNEVFASMQQGGVMVCRDGRITYVDESLLERITAQGRFVCTDWHLRESPSIVR